VIGNSKPDQINYSYSTSSFHVLLVALFADRFEVPKVDSLIVLEKNLPDVVSRKMHPFYLCSFPACLGYFASLTTLLPLSKMFSLSFGVTGRPGRDDRLAISGLLCSSSVHGGPDLEPRTLVRPSYGSTSLNIDTSDCVSCLTFVELLHLKLV
jgi:hypothetical protein